MMEVEFLPEWASKASNGDWTTRMAALPTKDGRACGNAVNAGEVINRFTTDCLYLIITDAGSTIKCTASELRNTFHPPEYIMERMLPAQQEAFELYNVEHAGELHFDYEFTTIKDGHYHPTQEEEADYWNGVGKITFHVDQNSKELDLFEITILDYSGCAGGLEESIGIDFYMKEYWDIQDIVKEGITYTVHGVTAHWTKGDGWETDDDVEYDYDRIVPHKHVWDYSKNKIKILWWRWIGYRLPKK